MKSLEIEIWQPAGIEQTFLEGQRSVCKGGQTPDARALKPMEIHEIPQKSVESMKIDEQATS